MSLIQLDVNEKGRGKFFIEEEGEQIADMEVDVGKKNLIAYHTEVLPKWEGKGLAKELLNHMVEYARTNQLKVIALCPYVNAQFRRHEELYADIWEKSLKAD
jgi:predicted GNAT family acetyltransferase